MFSRIIARLLGRGAPTDAEIERELRDHLELDAEELASDTGLGATDARFAARRRFGNVSNARDAARDVWHWSWIEQMEQDIRHGLRAIRRSPVYGAAVTLTLAMGVGAGTTAYTISRAVHDPFPALAQDRLLWIAEHNAPCGVDCTELSPAAFVALQKRAPSMHVIGTYSMRAALRGPSGSEMTSGFAVSPETWSVIGARFAAGHPRP